MQTLTGESTVDGFLEKAAAKEEARCTAKDRLADVPFEHNEAPDN